MDDAKYVERQLSEMLEGGEMKREDHKDAERRLISPKYEIRIQTHLDPIVVETLKYRSMANEVDDRYDYYMNRTSKSTGKRL